MKLFEKICVYKNKYKKRIVYFLGMPIYQYIKIRKNRKTKRYYSLIKKDFRPKKGQRVFYLKVHRVHKTSLDCIYHWIHTANEMNAFIYFVCDNPKMRDFIIKSVRFNHSNFAFIKSDRKYLKNAIDNILKNVQNKKMWQRIAFAMTTAYVHAHKNNYQLSYNIDADDIMLYLNAKDISNAFLKAEAYAKKSKIDLFNLDMFVSKSFGVHWSFGVVMCLNPKNCIQAINKYTNWRENKKIIKQYKTAYLEEFNYNIDWFFTYLRDTKRLNMQTFYINNALVVHMPDFILEHGWAFMFRWIDDKIVFPMLDFYDERLYTKNRKQLPIYKECVKIDIGINKNSYKEASVDFYYWSLYGQADFQQKMLKYAKIRGYTSPRSEISFVNISDMEKYLKFKNKRK